MKTLIKAAKIVDPASQHNGKKRDILIEKGVITKIAAKIEDKDAKVIDRKNLHVSPGWLDLRANFRDPGHEYKEDINSGLNAAARGGFTGVVIMPSTSPVIDSKSAVEYALKRAEGNTVELFVAGALSEGMAGKRLAELYDMHKAGAVLFTDDKEPVSNTEMMHRGMEYARNFDGTIMSFPFDEGICPGGLMHEGKMSTSLGMKGIPVIAESMRLQRDLDILRYTSSKLHVALISSAEGVKIIKQGKKEELNLSCSVAAANLVFSDEDLKLFNPDFKALPPYRSKEHQKALIKALKDGTIDAICSDHSPQDVEAKKREYENAEFGQSSIEATFSAAILALGDDPDSLSLIVERMSSGPRRILGLEPIQIEEGATANISLFDPELKWTYKKESIRSKSEYSPFRDLELKGKALGIIKGKRSEIF